jgi:predicted nucleic acid-binding protein
VRLVVDASVAVKWVFPDPVLEPDADRALGVLRALRDGTCEVLQPPHWLLEVMAVVTRVDPALAVTALGLLDALELPICNDLTVMRRAVDLAGALEHPMFDTLYHAVALERDAVLVTADARYARKACAHGQLLLLGEFVPAPAGEVQLLPCATSRTPGAAQPTRLGRRG